MSKEPLLKTVGYQGLLEQLTSENAEEARLLLEPFLQDFKGVDKEKVAILSYLLGVREGMHTMMSASGEEPSFNRRLTELYNTGRQHGFHQALLLFGKTPKIDVITPKKKTAPPDKGAKNNK
jgi:hypothetical protein